MPQNDSPANGQQLKKPVRAAASSTTSSSDTRMPWRPVGAASISLGAPAGVALLHPMLGEALVAIEIIVAVTILATALFGNATLSDRAFRLLNWFRNPSSGEGQD